MHTSRWGPLLSQNARAACRTKQLDSCITFSGRMFFLCGDLDRSALYCSYVAFHHCRNGSDPSNAKWKS